MEFKYAGDLEGFMRAWDLIIVAMSDVPPPDSLNALIETQLRACKQMDPVFTILDGNDPLQSLDPF